MEKNRLEAFSDGVLAIIITIMVLELKVPHALEHGSATLETLRPLLPVFLSYVLSFIYVGIYWNNHHHMLNAVGRISGRNLWANLHLLFWLSLIPFVTGWMGENHFATGPVALYGVVLLCAACAYLLLQRSLIKADGPDCLLAQAVGGDWKGNLSPLTYAAAIALAFVHPWISCALYIVAAAVWLLPDPRIERKIVPAERRPAADQ
jgi:uncharacterized membrane protein